MSSGLSSLDLSNKSIECLMRLWRSDVSLDIRVTNNGRWCDQKVLPDIMQLVCRVIVEEFKDRSFTNKNMLDTNCFVNNMLQAFNKPPVGESGAVREYNKVCLQPVNVLAAAGLVVADKKRIPHKFSVQTDGAAEIIQEMAGNEMRALHFLGLYISETCRQSGIDGLFEDFFDKQDVNSFDDLKSGYADFIKANTRINGLTEIHRIFRVVLNIQALQRKAKGTIKGRISPNPITLFDVRYNRTNFRDDFLGKPKHIPRQEWKKPLDISTLSHAYTDGVTVSGERRAINEVKEFHKGIPSIQDSHSSSDAPSPPIVHGHHVFPRGQYPGIRDFRENIILLTPTQHMIAHKDGFFQVNPDYQAFCLMRKLEEVWACEEDNDCDFYSIEKFKEMLEHANVLEASVLSRYKNKDDILHAIFSYYGRGEN